VRAKAARRGSRAGRGHKLAARGVIHVTVLAARGSIG